MVRSEDLRREAAPGGEAVPGGEAPPGPPVRGWGARTLSSFAIFDISVAIVIMLAVNAAGPSRAVVNIPFPAGPPWTLDLHVTVRLVVLALWTASIIGGAGVAVGLAAVARGAWPSPRWMAAAGLTVAAAFTVLPPAGSTDVLDYAAYGRMVVLGHNPYVMTPLDLHRLHDPIGFAAPHAWQHAVSAYGPLATVEQAAAAELGGTSAARIAFWLKLWTALAFGAVALALDRLLRGAPASRARAHLLWTMNPLLLWDVVAAGHVDGLAAAFGFFGLVITGRPHSGQRGDALRALAAGAFVGAAAGMKAPYALFGLGVIWAMRRSLLALTAVAAGAAAVLVPYYRASGQAALTALSSRTSLTTSDNFYQLFSRLFLHGSVTLPGVLPIAAAASVVAACLLLWRLPDGFPAWPAVRPALAVSLAWLFFWPYQRPWYDAMALCMLALYPASWVNWPVLGRLTAGTFFAMPGMPGKLPRTAFLQVAHLGQVLLVPLARLVTAVALIIGCLAGARHRHVPPRPWPEPTDAARDPGSEADFTD